MLNDAFGHLVLINVEISQNVLTLHIQIRRFLLLSCQLELRNSVSRCRYLVRYHAGFPSTVNSQKSWGGGGVKP